MSLDFYYLPISAPCRAVMLTAEALGVKLNLKEVNLFKGEHKAPSFVSINPQHCIPTIVDGDFILWESRAICSYLVSKYGKDDSLFPNDPRTRAEVERLLYFDMGTLFHRLKEYFVPVAFGGQKELDPAKLEQIHEALGWLNGMMAGHDFAVGNTVTIADHSLLASVTNLRAMGTDMSDYTNILAWLDRCKNKVPGFEHSDKLAREWYEFFKARGVFQ